MSSSELYRERLLDHYHHPRNFCIPKKITTTTQINNPSCGDMISISLFIEKGVIQDIGFQGSGCAISIAGASLLTEHARGKTVQEMTDFSKDDMVQLIGVPIGPGRIRCALLPWESLQNALTAIYKS